MERRGTDFRLERFGTRFQNVDSRYARRLLRPLHRGPLLETVRELGLRLSPAWRREFPQMLARNRALVEVLAELTGRPIVVDSSKSALRLKYLLRIPELDVRVIHLIRDGRAVALTYMDPERFADARDPQRRGGGNGTPRDGERLSMFAAARQWVRRNQEAACVVRTLEPGRAMTLRYEELCRDPSAALLQIRRFAGLSARPPVRLFRAVPQHVVGNGMRFDTSSAVVLDERWKDVLNADDLRTFDAVAGGLNRRYGYSDDRVTRYAQLT
jgi:hypothetical protein